MMHAQNVLGSSIYYTKIFKFFFLISLTIYYLFSDLLLLNAINAIIIIYLYKIKQPAINNAQMAIMEIIYKIGVINVLVYV